MTAAAVGAVVLGGLALGAVLVFAATWSERRRLAWAQKRADERRPPPVMLCALVDGYPLIELSSDELYHVAKFGAAGDDLLCPRWSLGGGLGLGEPLRVQLYAWPADGPRPAALLTDGDLTEG